MPSPFAHITMGYAIYRIFRRNPLQGNQARVWLFPSLFIITALLSMLPDIDSILGIIMGDFGRFNNNGTHSLVVGLVVAVAFASFIRWRLNYSFVTWFVIALISYEMHVIMDFFTVGRGVMLFWPFSRERYSSHVLLFYGLHWSDGVISVRHLWTLITEMGFLIIVSIFLKFFPRVRSGFLD